MPLNIQSTGTFYRELPKDKEPKNFIRQVFNACHSKVLPKKPKNPSWVHLNPYLCKSIGISPKEALSPKYLTLFSGARIAPNTQPYACCYGGHQFGHWAGQLGDGRAINLFEVSHAGNRWTLQLKGAGKTPYARRGDGLAVLRSSIREYLCSEAMYGLGIPTTRALSLILSGDDVLRDMLYNGNAQYEKGAIVCRASAGFIRFGNFEIFAQRGDTATLKKLTDYTLKKHFPQLGKPSKTTYVQLFEEVMNRSLSLVMHWQRVGFVHGVLNTDNISILGETIDYGPYGWLDDYDEHWTPNTTDLPQKRYCFGNQPDIVLWNLLQLANGLYPLIGDAQPLEAILNDYHKNCDGGYTQMMREKLGLTMAKKEDATLIEALRQQLQKSPTDMTIFFRGLGNFKKANPKQGVNIVKDSFYEPAKINGNIAEQWHDWFEKYHIRLLAEPITDEKRQAQMNRINPKYVLRNYMAQLAIDQANEGDYQLIDTLFELVQKPYNEQPKNERWYQKRPHWAKEKVGCSMLSCSS